VGRGFSRDNIASRKLGFSPCAALVLNSTRIYEMTASLHGAYTVDSSIILPNCGQKIKKPREKHEAHKAAPFLAKSAGYGGPGGCPDLRRFADHSGGTVADSHGLPRIPNLLNVETKSMLREERCQLLAARRIGQLRLAIPPKVELLDGHPAPRGLCSNC